MDLQFLPTPAHDRDAVAADREPPRWPGKSNLTSRLAGAPQLVFRVADAAVERTLNESFATARAANVAPRAAAPAGRAPVMRAAAALSDDPFAVHLPRPRTLEVSTPHDAAEHEADRAADAMVRGAPAQVASASGVARKLQREHDPYSSGESWRAQEDVEWNDAYAAKYKKKGGKRSADQDFEEQRNSGKVKSASEQSPKATKVKTTITSDQLTRIVSAGGEKDSATRIAGMAGGISGAFETMMIDTAQAQADYIAHMAGETGGILEEKQGEKRSYAPFQGRGAVQLTHAENYAKVLGTLQQRADQLDRQISDLADQANTLKIERDKAKDKDAKKKVEDKIDAIHKQMEPLKKQLGELYEAINAVKADPAAAADPRYAFLTSAAAMHMSNAVKGTGSMGSTAKFQGNGAADSWVSGGNAGKTFDARQTENESELAEIKEQLKNEDPDSAKAKELQGKAGARETLIKDMKSAKSRGAKKEAVYAAGMQILSSENAVPGAPATP